MQERDSAQRGPSGWRSAEGRKDAYQDNDEGRSRSMTTRPQQEPDDWSGHGSEGRWSGYVVPYRYYGPGYRGVGYYTVMYQGGGQDDAPESESQYGQRAAGYRQPYGWENRADAIGGNQSGRGFAGRGPKGYQRSDERLREEVSDRLMADDEIDASEIEVQVQDGEVTLTGTVDDRLAKRRAEDCAERVMGVRDVMNQLRVQAPTRSGSASRGGSGLTSGSRSGQESSSSQVSDTGRDESADAGATGSTRSNGRRKATSSR
jgi:osmotically-inducible protein OsmY